MNGTVIPDDIDTGVAIESALRDVERRWRSLYDVESDAESFVAYLVAQGADLARVRAAAISVAVIRDSRPTAAEIDARADAHAEYKAAAA